MKGACGSAAPARREGVAEEENGVQWSAVERGVNRPLLENGVEDEEAQVLRPPVAMVCVGHGPDVPHHATVRALLRARCIEVAG